MLRPYKRAACFTESDSAKLFLPAIYPSGQSLSRPEQKVQHIPPRLDRELQESETFCCPRVFTPLCLCNPHLWACCFAVYLFIFPLPGMLGEGGSAKPTWPSSPGHEHSVPFFCCLSRLPLVPAVNHLSPFLQNFTDTGQERKRPL